MSRILLSEADFPERPALLAERGAINIWGFRFASGVAALEIRNALGRIVVLPFQGQQIWDAWFYGRRLTMESPIPEPIPTRDYRANYGAFFLHCGGSAMGNPGPEDDHPLHGEAPNLPMREAELRLGADWVELHGLGVAESPAFEFRPSLRLSGESGLIEIGVDMRNLEPEPAPFFYLAHANFRPLEGAEILEGAEGLEMTIRNSGLAPDAPPEDRLWREAVERDPARHRRIMAGDRVVPEFVAVLRPSAAGVVATRQRHPDGRCDLLRHDSAQLPLIVRWMVRSAERQALGFSLPATASPDGRAAALRKGEGVWLAPGESFRAGLICGAES